MAKILFLDFDGVLNTQSWLSSAKQAAREKEWPGLPGPEPLDPQYREKAEAVRIANESNPKVQAFCRQRDIEQLCPWNIIHLNEIVRETDCQVVITSTWRIGSTVEYLKDVLHAAGFLYPEKVLGFTPGGGGFRGPQIREWLLTSPVPVESICILDDEHVGLEGFLRQLVQTKFWGDGLAGRHVAPAVALLNTPYFLKKW